MRRRDCISQSGVELADITYLSVFRGHFYSVAVMDWFSIKALSWQVSNMLLSASSQIRLKK